MALDHPLQIVLHELKHDILDESALVIFRVEKFLYKGGCTSIFTIFLHP